jgi:putative two-component system response regulator
MDEQSKSPSQTVLIVDSNVIECEGMASVLREAGYIVSMAPNANVALAYPTAVQGPDLIILDLMLPDGWHFLGKRKTNPQLANVPILIIAGFDMDSQEGAESFGAAGIVKKPIDEQELLREVERVSRPPQ